MVLSPKVLHLFAIVFLQRKTSLDRISTQCITACLDVCLLLGKWACKDIIH